jgi:hypothetical protein
VLLVVNAAENASEDAPRLFHTAHVVTNAMPQKSMMGETIIQRISVPGLLCIVTESGVTAFSVPTLFRRCKKRRIGRVHYGEERPMFHRRRGIQRYRDARGDFFFVDSCQMRSKKVEADCC